MGMTFNKEPNTKIQITINEDNMSELKSACLRVITMSIKDQVIHTVIPSLGPKNFEGEALNYMKDNKIPITEEGFPEIPNVREAIPGIKQISMEILLAFIKNIDDLVVFDENTKTIQLSPIINSFEYGDYFRPALKTITRAIENALPNND